MPTTATDEAVDLDVDLDAPVLCRARNCGKTATWHGKTTCPKRCSAVVCDEHKLRKDVALKTIAENGYRIDCGHCQGRVVPPYVEWFPL